MPVRLKERAEAEGKSLQELAEGRAGSVQAARRLPTPLCTAVIPLNVFVEVQWIAEDCARQGEIAEACSSHLPPPARSLPHPYPPPPPPRPPQELEQSARREREREAGRGRRAGGGDFGGARRSYLDDVGSGQEQRRMMRPDEGGGGGLKRKERERAAKRAEDRRRQVRGAGRPGRAACAIPQVLFWDSSSVLLSPGRPEA